MKKLVLISAFLVLILAGCQSSGRDESLAATKVNLSVETPNQTQVTEGTFDTTEGEELVGNLGPIQATEGTLETFGDEVLEYDPLPHIYNSTDAFLQDWAAAQANRDSAEMDVLLLNQFESDDAAPQIRVPVLHSQEYVLWEIDANEYNYVYYYNTSVGTVDPMDVSFSYAGFVIYVSKIASFEASLERRGLEAVDGMAYDSEKNHWCIDNAGKLITIDCPDGLVLENAERLAEYFTFDTYGISDQNQLMKVENTIE